MLATFKLVVTDDTGKYLAEQEHQLESNTAEDIIEGLLAKIYEDVKDETGHWPSNSLVYINGVLAD